MIQILLNGKRRGVKSTTLDALIGELDLTYKRIAVELNLEIIPRSIFAQTYLHEDDRIEIVQAIGGG